MLLFHFLNRSNTVADIQKQTPLITPGEPTLEEAGMKYIEQTEYALYELSEKITDFPKEKSRKFCSLIFEVSVHFVTHMHDLLLQFAAMVVVYTRS